MLHRLHAMREMWPVIATDRHMACWNLQSEAACC